MTYLEEVTRWPGRADEVTAQAVATYLMVSAQQARALSIAWFAGDSHPNSPESHRYVMALERAVGLHAAAAAVLAALQVAPEQADEVARAVWWSMENGEGDEQVWDWLTEHGISPQRLGDEVRERVTAALTEYAAETGKARRA